MCLEGWGTYLLSQDKPTDAARLLTRALKVSKEVLGEDHEQVCSGINRSITEGTLKTLGTRKLLVTFK